MFVFYIVVILCCVYILSSGKVEMYDLSRDKTQSFKGLLAICVLLGHLSFLVGGGFPYSGLYGLGLVAVNAFLFISGYGLMTSLKNKGNVYLQGFLTKRLSKVVMPFLLAVIVYLLIVFCVQGKTEIQSIWNGFLSGWFDSVLPFSWYVYSIVCFYLAFFAAFKIFSNKKTAIFALIFLIIFYCIGIRKGLHLPSFWYRSSFAFIVGVVYAFYLDSFVMFYRRFFKGIWISVILCCVGSWFFGLNEDSFFSNILVALSCIMLCSQLSLNLKSLNFLGTISYEIYLMQGVAMLICDKVLDMASYAYCIYFFSTILLTVLLAWMLSISIAFIEKIKMRVTHK